MTDAIASRVRLWIDTDVGDDPDDAVALCAAARHPLVDLVGVSTVSGNVDRRADLARALLDELDNRAPVYAGAPPPDALADADALLAIGPLTNVVELIGYLPPRMAIMGGATRAVDHRGERRTIEHNFSCNPVAAATVVRRCHNAVVVPLDVTAKMTLDDQQVAALANAEPALRGALDSWRAHTEFPVCLHDPLAFLVLMGEAPVTVVSRSLEVRGRGTLYVMVDGGERHDVATDVDAPAAIARVLELVEHRG
ncbi:MAG: hypothetical protein JWL83_1526 [Actinomycetia bacterium]|nr:hypothetical protein [Actinomycetes bacterium]